MHKMLLIAKTERKFGEFLLVKNYFLTHVFVEFTQNSPGLDFRYTLQ